jgi:hypothetical protein
VYRDKPGKPGSGSLLPRETAASTIPWHGFPLDIATHCPRPLPGAGEERAARAGWGLPERNFRVPFCPGRGRAPSPVPSPRGDSHHGPVYRDKPGKPGSGSLLPRETAASTIPWHGFPLDIATHCPRPPGGGGARSAGGVGATEAAYGYPPAKPRAGWGLPKQRTGIPLRRPGGVGGQRGALRRGWDEGRIGSVHLESMHSGGPGARCLDGALQTHPPGFANFRGTTGVNGC